MLITGNMVLKDCGVATLVAGTVTVSNTLVTSDSVIFITPQPSGDLDGIVRVSNITADTSFVITSTDNTDTAVIAYLIFN